MQEQNLNTETPQEIEKSKNLWPMVIAIVITAIVFGGLTYAWQASRINKIESNSNDKISALEQKLTILQTKINDIVKPTDTVGDEATKDSQKNSFSQEYSNSIFTISYPKEMRISSTRSLKKDNQELVMFHLWGDTQRGETEFYDGISLNISTVLMDPNEHNEYINNFIDEINSDISGTTATKTGESIEILDKITNQVYQTEDNPTGTSKYIFVSMGNMLFEIHYSTPGPNDTVVIKYQKIVDDMLTTLHLTSTK